MLGRSAVASAHGPRRVHVATEKFTVSNAKITNHTIKFLPYYFLDSELWVWPLGCNYYQEQHSTSPNCCCKTEEHIHVTLSRVSHLLASTWLYNLYSEVNHQSCSCCLYTSSHQIQTLHRNMWPFHYCKPQCLLENFWYQRNLKRKNAVYKILYRNPIYFCPTTAALVVMATCYHWNQNQR